MGGGFRTLTPINQKTRTVTKEMAKNKKSKFSKNKKGAPEADVEFAGENGLEKMAIKAQQNHNQ